MKARTTILAVILGLTVLVSAPVSAEVDHTSCGTLHDYWKEFKKEEQGRLLFWGLYAGYILGFAEYDINNSDRPLSLPSETGVTNNQVFYVVGKWLEDHPDKWHEPRRHCVYWALKEAYGLKD